MNEHPVDRRKFLKAGAGAGATGLLGLSGTVEAQQGATVEYWSVLHQQSEVAREAIEEEKRRFEERTPHTLEINFAITQSIQDGTWLRNMQQGQRPVLYDSQVSRNGQFIEPGFVQAFEDVVVPELDEETVSEMEWAFPALRSLYSGFEGEKFWEMPLGFVMQEPFVVRTDHMEEAGLDPESDFPPEDYDELLELARTLQNDGPGQFGFQIHGSPGDLMDEISPTWATASGGEAGLYVTPDWSDTNLDNEHWRQSLQRQVQIFQDEGLSSPNADTTSDEDAVQFLIQGQASMSQVGMLNAGIFTNRAPDLVEQGAFRFGPSWLGESGQRGQFNVTNMTLLSKPDDMDQARWDRKQSAAIEFMKQLLSQRVQSQTFERWGLLPVRQDVWDQVTGTPTGIAQAGIDIARESEVGWQAHPRMSDIQYNIPGPIFQQALTGELSVEEATSQAAETIRSQVFE